MTRRFAIFDQSALGPFLDIRQSGEVLGIIGTGLNTNRTARGNIGVTGGVRSFEAIVWGEDDMEAAVGVVTGTASLSLPVGSAGGVGLDLATGAVRVDGSTVTTASPVAKGAVVGVRLDLQQDIVTFRVNGADVAAVDISALSGTWCPAGSLGSDTEGDLQMFLGSGQRAAYFPDPVAPLGWYTVPPQISPLWIGSEEWITDPTDEPPNQPVEEVIPLGASAFTTTRELVWWTQATGDERTSMTIPSAAAIAILDADHAYDHLISGDVRDVKVWAMEVERGQTLAQATTIGTFLLDRVDVVSDIQKGAVLKDNTVRFDNPLQRLLFPPSVDSTAANRPYRISLGAVFSVDPLLWDSMSRSYNLHDTNILGIGFVRDKGDKLDSTIPDFELTPDGRGIALENDPAGKLTVDLSSVGGDTLIPPTNLLPANLAGWDSSDHVTFGAGQYTFGDSYTGTMRSVEAYLKMDAILGSMKLYRYRLTIDTMSGYFGSTGQKAQLQFIRSILSGGKPGLVLEVFHEPGVYTGTFRNTSAGTNDFLVAMVGTQAPFDQIKISATLELYEVDETPVDSANLLPIKLAPFVQEIMARAGFLPSEYDLTSAQDIDDITDYAGIGWHAAEQVPVSRPFNDVLPSYGCCMAQDRNGVFRIYRMVAPEGETATAEITQADMLSPLRITLDEAPGLTNQFGLQRNEIVLDPTDFVDDYDPVTGIDLLTRAKLSRRYREIVATGGSFANAYPFAYSAPALGTRFVRVADAQAELDRIRAIYAVERKFYSVEVPMEDDYDLGQIVRLFYPYYGLSDGKNLMVVRIVEDRINRKCTLTLWG